MTPQIISTVYPERRELITVEISMNGATTETDLVVYYKFYPSVPGNREIAPECEHIEITSIWIANHEGKAIRDITPLLCDAWHDALSVAVLDARRN